MTLLYSNTIITFADDTTVVSLITNNKETAYREEVRDLAVWLPGQQPLPQCNQDKGGDCGLQEMEGRATPPFTSMGL